MEDADTCAFLLQCTVFLPTGPDTYRFVHRSWQEFLWRSISRSVLNGLVLNTSVAPSFTRRLSYGGEILPHTIIDQTMIEHVLATWSKESERSYLMSNVIGFLAWTRTPVEAQAIQRLLDAVPHLDALSRIILIGGLGYRILLDDPRDPSLTDLRSVFIPTLRAFSDPANAPFDDPVASSLAWCYQKAFTHTSGIQTPTTPRPTLGFEDHETLKAPAHDLHISRREADAGRTVALAATRAPHPLARYRQPSPIRDPRAPLSLLPRGGPEACGACVRSLPRAASSAGPWIAV